MVECGRCGRKLSNETSVSRGYGPVCWLVVREEVKSRMKPLREVFDDA